VGAARAWQAPEPTPPRRAAEVARARRGLPPSLSIALLIALCLAVDLPGQARIPVVDRDEARFAQASRQMLETGDLLVPRFQAEPRLKKPIGIYWLQAGAARLAGGTSASPQSALVAFRFPSLAASVLAVLSTYALGRRLFGGATALLGAALLAVAALAVVEAHLATTDAALLACSSIAQGCLASLYAAQRRGCQSSRRAALGFWLALAAAMLLKGPVLPLVSGLTIAVLLVADARRGDVPLRSAALRFGRALRGSWGAPLCLAISLPWPLLVGRAFFEESIGRDVLPKVLSGQESHGLPPGTYLALALVTFWPGSLLAPGGVRRALARRHRTAERFLLAWLVPSWLVFELIPTKLPHYVLPLYPALALLTARGVHAVAARVAGGGRMRRPAEEATRAPSRLAAAWLDVWIGFTLLTALAIAAAAFLLDGGFWATVAGAMAAALVALAAFGVRRCVQRGEGERAAWLAIAGAVALFAIAFASVLPGLEGLWPSRALVRAVEGLSPAGQPRAIAAVGYLEPSLVYLLDGRVALLDAQAAVDFAARTPDGLVVADEAALPELRAAAAARGVAFAERWSGSSLHYSKGRRTRLLVLEAVR
jgi:4-amino-4-deoxy-L-arabinose transferase-like glycosyltransferase